MPALDFDAFRRSVKKGEILPAYYLYGDEDLLKDDSLRDLLGAALDPSTRDFNLDRRRAADLTADDFATLTLTPPMLAQRRAVLITEVEMLQQKRPRVQALREILLKYLADPSPDTLLVLVQSAKKDKDPDLSRLATSVAFDALPAERILKWIRNRAEKEGLRIDDQGVEHLHDAVGDDLAQLAAEIAKLKAAVPESAVSVDDVADLIGVRRGETVHDFVDAVTGRKPAVAAGMVAHLLGGPGNSGVIMLGAMSTSLTGVALARARLDRGDSPGSVRSDLKNLLWTARPWGLRKYEVEAEHWVHDAARWTPAELDAALATLLRADQRLKNPSLGGEVEIVVDAVLAMAGAGTAAA